MRRLTAEYKIAPNMPPLMLSESGRVEGFEQLDQWAHNNIAPWNVANKQAAEMMLTERERYQLLIARLLGCTLAFREDMAERIGR